MALRSENAKESKHGICGVLVQSVSSSNSPAQKLPKLKYKGQNGERGGRTEAAKIDAQYLSRAIFPLLEVRIKRLKQMIDYDGSAIFCMTTNKKRNNNCKPINKENRFKKYPLDFY